MLLFLARHAERRSLELRARAKKSNTNCHTKESFTLDKDWIDLCIFFLDGSSSEQYPNILDIQPSRTVEVTSGGQVQLFCNVEVSGQQATVSWLRNGQPIGYGPTLYLDNVMVEDNGEYVCRAQNTAGYIEQSAYIYVIESKYDSTLLP